MPKINQQLNWKSVPIEGFPILSSSEKFNSLIGLEECSEYDFDTYNTSFKETKRKRKNIKPCQQDKKIRLQNGFFVEPCLKVKPSIPNAAVSNTCITEESDSGIEVGYDENKTCNMEAWSYLNIPTEILQALSEMGFKQPTRVQELTLPAAMYGRRDILAAAETGSGKTLAFGIPLLSAIMKLQNSEEADLKPYKKSSVKKTPNIVMKPKVQGKRRKQANADSENTKKPTYGAENKYVTNSDLAKEDSKDSTESDSFDENKYVFKKSAKNFKHEQLNSKNDTSDNKVNQPSQSKEKVSESESDNDSDSENYVRLSEMVDSDDLADSSDENSDQETPSDDSIEDIEGSHNKVVSANGLDKGIGLVKVIDKLETHRKDTCGGLYALILAPTRELALQVTSHLKKAAKYTGIKFACLVGGLAVQKQERELRARPHVVVATPGRLHHLLRAGDPHLAHIDNIKMLVVDEADRMLEPSRYRELKTLLSRLNASPAAASRQSMLFSATLTQDISQNKAKGREGSKESSVKSVKHLVSMLAITDPKIVDLTVDNYGTAASLEEYKIICSEQSKDYYLYSILRQRQVPTIVFCNSISCVKRVTGLLRAAGVDAAPLHASLPQRSRLQHLDRLRDGESCTLVATDVAARGLDIPSVNRVIHYHVPRTSQMYVHRSGRAGRAGARGEAVLLVAPAEHALYAKLLRRLDNREIAAYAVDSEAVSLAKRIVTLARQIDVATHRRRKQLTEASWLQRAADSADILLDDNEIRSSSLQEPATVKELQAKKKELQKLLAAPVFPRGFSFKYPTLNQDMSEFLKSDTNKKKKKRGKQQ